MHKVKKVFEKNSSFLGVVSCVFKGDGKMVGQN